jgi:hypothetical protein
LGGGAKPIRFLSWDFIFSFLMLGIKPRVSHLPGKCSAIELHLSLLSLDSKEFDVVVVTEGENFKKRRVR